MPEKVYLEITNRCNLACTFCHGTKRQAKSLTKEEFEILTDRLRGIPYLYFHLMGEPLFHPELPYFVKRANEKGFRPMITTNGTLLGTCGKALIASDPYKISISLHAVEGNGGRASEGYLQTVIAFAKEASESGIITVLRLWNEGGAEKENPAILRKLEEAFPAPWQNQRSGKKVREKLYLEYGKTFAWPDAHGTGNGSDDPAANAVFCYGLRDQIGVLADGTVVPCCLDADGAIALGNLFDQPLEEILYSPRAKRMYDGFTAHCAVEPLCLSCGYARKTKRYRSKSGGQ